MLPLVSAFLYLLLTLAGIIGIVILFIGSKKKELKPTYLTVGSLIIGFVLYNFINERLIYNQYKNENVGTFINTEYNLKFQFNDDGTWNASKGIFGCSQGDWDYIITEDGAWINLESTCQSHFTYQIQPPRNTGEVKVSDIALRRVSQ